MQWIRDNPKQTIFYIVEGVLFFVPGGFYGPVLRWLGWGRLGVRAGMRLPLTDEYLLPMLTHVRILRRVVPVFLRWIRSTRRLVCDIHQCEYGWRGKGDIGQMDSFWCLAGERVVETLLEQHGAAGQCVM